MDETLDTLGYVIQLLERIAYQTSGSQFEFEQYLHTLCGKKDDAGSTTPARAQGIPPPADRADRPPEKKRTPKKH